MYAFFCDWILVSQVRIVMCRKLSLFCNWIRKFEKLNFPKSWQQVFLVDSRSLKQQWEIGNFDVSTGKLWSKRQTCGAYIKSNPIFFKREYERRTKKLFLSFCGYVISIMGFFYGENDCTNSSKCPVLLY